MNLVRLTDETHYNCFFVYLILKLPTFHTYKFHISSVSPMIPCFGMEITLLWCAHFLTRTVWFHDKQMGFDPEHQD